MRQRSIFVKWGQTRKPMVTRSPSINIPSEVCHQSPSIELSKDMSHCSLVYAEAARTYKPLKTHFTLCMWDNNFYKEHIKIPFLVFSSTWI